MTCMQDCLREAELEALCDRKDARIAELEAALCRAVEWGVASKGYDGEMARQLRQWIDNGMTGPLPPEPEWLRDMRETLEKMRERTG